MLKLQNLSLTFHRGTVNEKTALHGLDLEVGNGEFVTILGTNGAGKSTLFNLISGTVFPDSGKIFLDGRDVTRLPDYKRAKQIGRLWQDPLRGTAPGMTIEENLALAYLRSRRARSPFSMLTGRDRAEFRERLALLGLGLEDRMGQPVGQLSGGQRQALALLMATLVPPKLLLLDEHTAALDPATARGILELTRQIVEENAITCLMITHDLELGLTLGGRTILLSNGTVRMDLRGAEREKLTPEELFNAFQE